MDYYTNSGQLWSSQEEKQIKKEYNEDNLDINEIGKIHKRTPGGIGSRLCILGVIEHRVSARGYSEYKNSDLYKEICEKGPYKRKKPKEKKIKTSITESNVLISIKQSDYDNLIEEIYDVKDELHEIKNMIKNLAIYDFNE